MLSVLAKQQSDDAALAWLSTNSLTVADLTANGVLTLCQIYLRKNDFEGLVQTHAEITYEQCVESPFLFFSRGALRFASILAKPEREKAAFSGIPLDAQFAHPVLPDFELRAHLDAAIADLQRVQPIALELGLREAGRIAEAYIRWSELLHPGRKQAALTKLRKDMTELKSALPHVQFALAYDPEFDPKPLTSLLEKREALGGLDDDELRAALVLRLHSDDPRAVADFIGKYRSRFEADVGQTRILSIEIQALAMAKEATSARILLDARKDLFPSQLAALLDAEIAKAEGNDPIAEHKRVYEETRTPGALRALVGALVAGRIAWRSRGTPRNCMDIPGIRTTSQWLHVLLPTWMTIIFYGSSTPIHLSKTATCLLHVITRGFSSGSGRFRRPSSSRKRSVKPVRNYATSIWKSQSQWSPANGKHLAQR